MRVNRATTDSAVEPAADALLPSAGKENRAPEHAEGKDTAKPSRASAGKARKNRQVLRPPARVTAEREAQEGQSAGEPSMGLPVLEPEPCAEPPPARPALARRTSALSGHLEASAPGGLEAGTADIVDDIVKHMHRVEMKHIVSAPAIARNVNLAHRRKVVAWLVKVFHVVSFDDNILYGTVRLADAFLDKCGKHISGTTLQSVIMACLCTVLKLQTAESRAYPVCDLLAHITHNQILVSRVLTCEREVLVTVDFNVSSPTAFEWLEIFSARVASPRAASPRADGGDGEVHVWWPGMAFAPSPQPVVGGPAGARPKFVHCADFLCQLAMLNHLLLEVPPSLIAASALILSTWALDGPAAVKAALLEDVGAVWSLHKKDQAATLADAMASLHTEWVTPVDATAAVSIVEKFQSPQRHAVSSVRPPDAVPDLFSVVSPRSA